MYMHFAHAFVIAILVPYQARVPLDLKYQSQECGLPVLQTPSGSAQEVPLSSGTYGPPLISASGGECNWQEPGGHPVLQVSDPLPCHAGHKLNPGGVAECYHGHEPLKPLIFLSSNLHHFFPPSPSLPSPPFSSLLPCLPPSFPPFFSPSLPPPLFPSLPPTHAVRLG